MGTFKFGPWSQTHLEIPVLSLAISPQACSDFGMAHWDKDKIKALRKSLKLSQSEFAFKLGCRQQTVSEWELGLYAPANAYGKLLDSFNSVAATSAPWLSTPKVKNVVEELAAEAAKQWSEPREDVLEVHPEVREFDPAID